MTDVSDGVFSKKLVRVGSGLTGESRSCGRTLRSKDRTRATDASRDEPREREARGDGVWFG